MKRGVFFLLFSLLMTLCVHAEGAVWNNPYKETDTVIRYSSFSSPPRTLDPAKAYSSNELQFIAQIYQRIIRATYKLAWVISLDRSLVELSGSANLISA